MTTDVLASVTAQDLSEWIGRTVTSFSVRPWERYSSHQMRELTLNLQDGSAVAVMLKGLHEGAHLKEARAARPLFYYEPLREIDAYRAVLSRLDLDTPTYYGAHVDEEGGQYWLVVENVLGAVPLRECALESFVDSARWLSRFHSALGAAEVARLPASLIRYDAPFYRRWADRAAEFCPQVRPLVEPKRYRRAIERLTSMRQTFIHGEFYSSNVLVEGERIRPIDWETAGVGPALMDVAALSAGAWTEAKREQILAAYGPIDRSDLDFCRLHIAVQWLGWSDQWKPEKLHAHDWAAEATMLAERLGL